MSKIIAVARAQLTFQMSTLLQKYILMIYIDIVSTDISAPFYKHGVTDISACIYNHMNCFCGVYYPCRNLSQGTDDYLHPTKWV